MLEQFTLGTLAEMDGGRIKAAFEQALNRCRHDCEDRPSIAGARKITLTVTLEPVAADSGELESVDVSFALNEKLPNRASKTYNMEAVTGGLLFNELSPDEVRQRTLDMAPKPGESAPPKGAKPRKDRTGEVADVG
jgi:hypothetical protein